MREVRGGLTDGATRVSVNPHEQLVQLLVIQSFAKNFAKGCDELRVEDID